jgi:hypothetical protein
MRGGVGGRGKRGEKRTVGGQKRSSRGRVDLPERGNGGSVTMGKTDKAAGRMEGVGEREANNHGTEMERERERRGEEEEEEKKKKRETQETTGAWALPHKIPVRGMRLAVLGRSVARR